jgi:hypothetical protein
MRSTYAALPHITYRQTPAVYTEFLKVEQQKKADLNIYNSSQYQLIETVNATNVQLSHDVPPSLYQRPALSMPVYLPLDQNQNPYPTVMRPRTFTGH